MSLPISGTVNQGSGGSNKVATVVIITRAVIIILAYFKTLHLSKAF